MGLDFRCSFAGRTSESGARVLAVFPLSCLASNTKDVRELQPQQLLASGVADCSSFLDVTVTPATLTFTETATVQTESRGQEPQGGAATADGTTFPAYASTCTSYAKYASACSCVGVAAPSVTVTETAISTPATRTTAVATETLSQTIDVSVTDTTVVTVFSSTSTTTTSTSTVVRSIGPTNAFKNGNFEYGSWGPWIETNPKTSETTRHIVGGVVKGTGADGGHAAVMAGMWNNDLWEFSQVFNHQGNVRYRCDYDWKFTNYYETLYPNGKTYVPYIHGYLNNEIWTIDVPDGRPQRVGEGQTTTFTFLISWSGRSTWWFDCGSPQAPDGEGGGNNTLYIDNVYCIPEVVGD
ncbi:hypothetical protein RB596_004289 [Gaeumannomyces avenae]